MIDKLKKPWRNVALAALVLLVGWFCWTIRAVLNPLILGYLLAYVAHPMVLRLERRGWSRRTAVNVIFVGTGLGLALATVLVILQGQSLVQRLSDPELHERMWTRLERELDQHEAKIAWLTAHLPGQGEHAPAAGEAADAQPAAEGTSEPSALAELRTALEEWTSALFAEENLSRTRDAGLAVAGGVLGFLQRLFGSILAVFTLLVLLPIYTYFLLFELERIHRFVRHYLPAGERTRLSRVGSQIGEVLANFFRGRLLVCLVKGLCYALGLWIAGIDYALLIGLGTGFLSLVPFAGSLLGLVAAALIGFLEHSLVGSLVRVAVVFGVVELVENYVLVPKILGDSLALHPVVVIFAVMAGGAALGMFGLLVALPAAAALVILTREFVLPALEQIAQGDGGRRDSTES